MGCILLFAALVTSATSQHSENAKYVYRQTKGSILVVYGIDPKIPAPYVRGAAFLVSREGKTTVVTARHVVDDDAMKYQLGTHDGKRIDVTGRKPHASHDLAVLEVKNPKWSTGLKLAPTDPEVGTTVYALGHPSPDHRTFQYWIQAGIVNGYMADKVGLVIPPKDFTGDYMGISAVLIPGNSGGAVVNEKGEVVGVAACGYQRGTLCFAVPVSLLRAFL
jgi:S1-C subfamily serine protease